RAQRLRLSIGYEIEVQPHARIQHEGSLDCDDSSLTGFAAVADFHLSLFPRNDDPLANGQPQDDAGDRNEDNQLVSHQPTTPSLPSIEDRFAPPKSECLADPYEFRNRQLR